MNKNRKTNEGIVGFYFVLFFILQYLTISIYFPKQSHLKIIKNGLTVWKSLVFREYYLFFKTKESKECRTKRKYRKNGTGSGIS